VPGAGFEPARPQGA